MNNKVIKVKLTERDKNIIVANSNICTDSHGKGCAVAKNKESDKNLN